MSEDDRKILVDNHSILLSDMFDVTIIDGYLRRARILSAPALEYILSTNTRYKRVWRLLIVLPFCGSRALGELKEALKESGQTHLASALDDKSGNPCTCWFLSSKYYAHTYIEVQTCSHRSQITSGCPVSYQKFSKPLHFTFLNTFSLFPLNVNHISSIVVWMWD